MQSNEKKTRKIKISCGYTSPTSDFIPKYTPVPKIQISGKYLINLGFNIHDTVTISLSHGLIEIKKV